ncbi:hypothetical protein Tco_1504152 [Tanacetum coccineum]
MLTPIRDLSTYKMANENVPAPAPTRSDDQILPFAAWVPIGKRNYAFTTSASVPAIYIQQLWNTLTYEAKTRAYSFELDETRFILDANFLREALDITPIDQAHQFLSPPSVDAIMDFVNELGYTEGIITSINVDYAELMWEEFVQAILTFLTYKANLGSPTKKGRKDKPHVIPYFYLRLGKSQIRELISNNISNAPYYNAYMEMVAKYDRKITAEKEGKKQPASAKQPKSKSGIEKSSKPVLASKPKPAKEKPSKPSTAKLSKPKPAKEKSTKDTPLQKVGKGKVAKVRNVKSSFQLVDEPDEEPTQPEPEPEPEHQGEGEEYDVECAIKMNLESFHAAGHAHVRGVAICEPVVEATRPLSIVKAKEKLLLLKNKLPNHSIEEASTGPSVQPQDDTSANIVRDSPSSADAETGEDVDKKVILKEKTVELDQDQAGSDPGETHESRPPPEQVQESLKFSADEHVILEDPLSSTGTLSSMKNLEDAYTIGDQFFNDKSTKDEPGKLNVEPEVVSMATVPIYQASSSVLPLPTPVIDLSSPFKHSIKKNLDNTTKNLGSRVSTLELRDLPHKIDGTICETVKEVVQVALQAPLRDRFRDLSDEDMKEMLHQRMFESGPPPPLLDSDLSKKKRHDSGASGSSQPPTPQSFAWKTTDARKAPSSSSKKHSSPHVEQPVEDIPIPDTANISDLEDTDSTHLPNIK